MRSIKKIILLLIILLVAFSLVLGTIGVWFLYRFNQSMEILTTNSNSNYLFLGVNKSIISDCQSQALGTLEEPLSQELSSLLATYLSQDFQLHNENSLNTLALSLKNDKIGCAIVDKDSYEALSNNHYLKKTASLLLDTTNEAKESTSPLFTQTVHILLSGIDTLGNARVNTRSDMNMLVSLNIDRKEVLLTSIPRDAYIKNTCMYNKLDKLTHTSNQGITCTVQSLEQLLSIDIPYYVRLSFSSVIEAVDLLGGLEIDVPINYCEYNEYKKIIYVHKGLQTLNGSQVLSLARHRYTLKGGDMDRNKNQQRILQALINKTMDFRTFLILEDILELLERNISTNLSKEDIYQLIQLQTQDTRPFTMRTQALKGYGKEAYTASIPTIPMSVLELSTSSLKQVTQQLNNMEKEIDLSSFMYSINTNQSPPSLEVQQGTSTCHLS